MSYKLYFSEHCQDTAPFVAELEKQGIVYEAINITGSMPALKEFLKLRDTRPEFEARKMWGMVGIPVLLLPNNRMIFELNDLQGVSCQLTPRD